MILAYSVIDDLQLELALLKYYIDLNQTEVLVCKLITKIMLFHTF